jgi:DNA polymerase III alpha subunit
MLKERSALLRLCAAGLEQKGLAADPRYKDRLRKEIREIDAQGEHEYLLNLHLKFKKEGLMFPDNEHNNLVDFLLGLAPVFDLERESAYVQGEFPDIDIDYIKAVRDYLKRDWAAATFGQDQICEIGTYGTAGIKSAILDMASVHGVSKSEIQSITVRMEDKDDEGKTLEWDKIFELAERERKKKEEDKKAGKQGNEESNYLKFAEWCEEHPEVAEAARLMQGRNKNAGVHAGGLIIADRPIHDFVPMEVRSVKKETPEGVICSAWTEGLNAQDLQPVGLIKFDLLVINNLMQIAQACALVKERHGLNAICATEGGWDFSDISYLNDPEALAMANRADLKCIFQFDSDGIRKLVKRGGVTRFDDLAAYSALYRPGPLGMGMDARYCKRKKFTLDPKDEDAEPFSIHPLMEPILGKTYGVMAYQEQVMDILGVVGDVPDMHREKVRKAISKKKVKQFIKYKEQFVERGMVNLGVNADFCLNLWDQIESFAEYGFNKSHAYAYTYISARLLWLKAHYPLEFYTAILMCENDDEKFKEYKLDAKKHGVEVCPVDINQSRANFNIANDKIYFGFRNIKGVGEAVAERIVQSQPYTSFADFLGRFGTDGGPLKALIAIGVFDDLEPDHDREHLRKFHEFYKDMTKKRRDRQKRFELAMQKKDVELRELLLTQVNEDDPLFDQMCQYNEDAETLWDAKLSGIMVTVDYKSKGEIKQKEVEFVDQLKALARKRNNSLSNFESKEREDDENPVTMDQFNAGAIKLDEEELAILRNEMVIDGEKTYPEAESLYYGFQWRHVLETSPDFKPEHTIDHVLEECEAQRGNLGVIQVLIKSVRKRTSRSGTEFYSVDLEDANSRQMKMNVWMDDFTRWREELRANKMLYLRIRPPSGGYNTLTLESIPRHKRKDYIPEDDIRVVEMAAPKPVEEEKVDLDGFQFDESAVDVL